MLANLYIHADAIKYNDIDTESEFYSKFALLLRDLNEIRNQYGEENIIKVSPCLSLVKLFKEKTLYEVISQLEPEERNFVFSVICNTSEECDLPLSQLLELCKYQVDETECNTVIFLNKKVSNPQQFPVDYITFDQYEIIYDKDSWHTLRRQIMGNHPGTPHEFIQAAIIHFPNIVFHPNCESSITGYLDKIPRKIVYYLSCMNDKLLEHKSLTGISDENILLADFCGKYKFDEAGSRQSTPIKKKSYQFGFLKRGCVDEPKNYKTITCDPHMKISSCDNNNNFIARIYFHFGDDDIAPNKLLVGSIGPHV